MQGSSVLYVLLLLYLPSFLLGMERENLATQYAQCTSIKQFYFMTDSLSEKERVQILCEIAVSRKNSDPKLANVFAMEAKRLAGNLGLDKELANAYHCLGGIAWNKNKFDDAVRFYYQARGLREQINDSFGLVDSYIQIGNIYLRQNYNRDAEYYYHSAVTICNKIDYKKGFINGDIAHGALFSKIGEWDKAQACFENALNQSQQINYLEGCAAALTGLGQQFLAKGDNKNAYDYFSNVLKKRRAQNDQYNVIKILSLLAQVLVNKNELSQAEELAKESLSISKKMEMPAVQTEALTVLSQIYQKTKNFEQAYLAEKERLALYQQLTSVVMERNIAEVQLNYMETEKKLQELKTSNDILKDKQQITRLSKWLVLITLLGVIIITGFYHSKLRLGVKSNRLLESKNKELQETNSALEHFAYVASHDLKEPLRTISSFTSLIARKYRPLLDDKGQEYIDFVIKGVTHMSELLEDLLRYSRLINKKEFVPESVNIKQVVESVENMLSKKIGESNAAIKYSEMPVINANSVQMHQLFQNLIANGLKFNDKASPVIEISCEKKDSNYLFAIRDNGIGIDEKYHNKIFEMFQRLSKNEYPGTGIGLAICQKIIELNEGKMWLESTVGQGSTFYFSLPIEKAN